MPSVVLYFHLHQPLRVASFSLFDVGHQADYYSPKTHPNHLNRDILLKVSQKCYLPANTLMLRLLKRYPQFKLSYSITGTLIEQLLLYQPEVIRQLKAMAQTGQVEFLDETYYHSLSSLFSKKEFFRQVSLHQQIIYELFKQKPTSFRNTELIYNDQIAQQVASMGYKTILAEGVDRYLSWRSPNFVYTPASAPSLKLLLKNYRLSDDIAFRFGNQSWPGWPLTASKFASWISALNGSADLVNLFMDYETIGEHQWKDTGIFDFFKHLPHEILKNSDNRFLTVSEAAQAYPSKDTVSMPETTSWADMERDVTAWLGNPLQQQATASLYKLEADVYATQDQTIIRAWQNLTTSDHFYYMCTKWFEDGDVHKYFSPNSSPYEAYTYFSNILHDLRQKLYAKQGLSLESLSKNYQLLTGIPAHDHRYSQAL